MTLWHKSHRVAYRSVNTDTRANT